MRKLFYAALPLMLAFAIAGCGAKDSGSSKTIVSQPQSKPKPQKKIDIPFDYQGKSEGMLFTAHNGKLTMTLAGADKNEWQGTNVNSWCLFDYNSKALRTEAKTWPKGATSLTLNFTTKPARLASDTPGSRDMICVPESDGVAYIMAGMTRQDKKPIVYKGEDKGFAFTATLSPISGTYYGTSYEIDHMALLVDANGSGKEQELANADNLTGYCTQSVAGQIMAGVVDESDGEFDTWKNKQYLFHPSAYANFTDLDKFVKGKSSFYCGLADQDYADLHKAKTTFAMAKMDLVR